MAINEIPVGLDRIFFVSMAEDFQKETDEDGREVNRTSYSGDAYQLDVQVSAFVEERGLRALTSQAVTVEVPIEGASEVLKKIRSLPEMTEVKLPGLSVRTGVSQKGKAYSMWSAKGFEVVKPAQPAQRQAPAQA